MVDLYFIIYCCMIPLIIAVGCVVAGYQKSCGKIQRAHDIIGPTMILSALWPGLLAIACIMVPFVALYHVGQFLAARN